MSGGLGEARNKSPAVACGEGDFRGRQVAAPCPAVVIGERMKKDYLATAPVRKLFLQAKNC
jgi:hypothetical protein